MTRAGLALLFAAAMSTWTTPAFADATMCTTAAERGQSNRTRGKLLEARRQFLACTSTECPAIVTQDCSTWAAEVLASTPTIVIDAKDEAGHDIGDATLTIDGGVMAHQLDGKAMPIDPGSHTVEIASNSGPSKRGTQTFIAKEGEKTRSIRILVTASADSDGHEPSAHTTAPWIVFGTGVGMAVTGIVVYLLLTGSYPPGCDSDGCVDDSNRDAADAVLTKHTIGATLMIGGTLAAAVGLIWHFTEKPMPRATIAPWYDVASGGLMLRTTFQ